jgi:chromosome partitioning protein
MLPGCYSSMLAGCDAATEACLYTVAIAQQKGGVGKTTSVANLAAALAGPGRRVLALDGDPQGSLTLSFGIDPVEVTATIGDAMLAGSPIPVTPTQVPGLDLCPSTRLLADAEFHLAPKVGRERFLARTLDQVQDRYDFVLIDTPPSLGLLTINCLAAANALFVPVTPGLLGAAGLRDLLATVEEIRQGINPALQLGGVFVTFADQRTLAGRRAEAELREDLGALVMTTTISRRIAHEYAVQAGRPAVALDPSGIAALEYLALAEEMLTRVASQTAPPSEFDPAHRCAAIG